MLQLRLPVCIVTALIPLTPARQSLIQRKGSDFFAPVGVASYVSDDTTLAETADHLPDVPSAVEDIIPASVRIQARGW